jgi:Trp operon repressor
MEQDQQQQVQWRRDKVQELCSKSYDQREISQTLQVGLITANRDISYLRIMPNKISKDTLTRSGTRTKIGLKI